MNTRDELEKDEDWQIVTIAGTFVDEIDCNSGARRRVFSNGEIQSL